MAAPAEDEQTQPFQRPTSTYELSDDSDSEEEETEESIVEQEKKLLAKRLGLGYGAYLEEAKYGQPDWRKPVEGPGPNYRGYASNQHGGPPEIRKYMKAFELKQIRKFAKWHERLYFQTREDILSLGDQGVQPYDLKDDHIVFIQDNYIVTKGLFADRNVIFNDVDADWIKFCKEELKFAVSADVKYQPQEIASFVSPYNVPREPIY